MDIKIYPKDLLEQVWQLDRERFSPDTETFPACLRCGKPLNQRLPINALSRRADVYICQECGSEEALLDALGEPDSLLDWHAVTSERVGLFSLEGVALVPACSFEQIFTGPKKLFPLSSVEHPVSEVAYSRSDYDGRKWWRTWFPSNEGKIEPELSAEIDQFSNALMELPEFKSLNTMRQLCRLCAQPTGSPTDFNLFSETEHFYIWLQLVTWDRDYNLYVHFYLKSQIN